MVRRDELFLGIDGGGTRCRGRLMLGTGAVLGEGEAGPANLRLGFLGAFAAVLDAARRVDPDRPRHLQKVIRTR